MCSASVKATKKPSTYKSYSQMVGLALPHLGEIELRDFHTPEAQALLDAALVIRRAPHNPPKSKAVLSAAFRFANRRRCG